MSPPRTRAGSPQRRGGARSIDRSSPPWMVTYGDMATLLLVFFVFLFSVSEVREDKFRAAAGALRAQIGVRPKRGSSVEARKPVEARRRERREKVRLGLPGKSEKVRAAATGARVAVGGRVNFARGSADIPIEAMKSLRELADELRGLPNILEVRGHAERGEAASGPARAVPGPPTGEVGPGPAEEPTDRAPAEDEDGGPPPPRPADKPGEARPVERYEDDLALSLARAAGVLRFLAEEAGLERSRLRAVGAGAEEPVFHKEEPRRDRRVEIVMLRETGPSARPAGRKATTDEHR